MEVVEKKPREQDILELLEKIHQGYTPAQREQSWLEEQGKLTLFGTQVLILKEGAKYLTGLRRLTLKRTPRFLPVELGQLKSLRKLSIFGEVTSIPYTIGQLKQLMRLELRCDNLKMLPGSLCALPKLKYLTLSCPNLEELPKQFGQLKALRLLKLQCRQLRQLEKRLYRLKNLTLLSIDDVVSQDLLCEISMLTELRVLQLHTEHDVTLPNAIGKLCNLKILKLFCAKAQLPSGIEQLSQLQKLYLTCDGLKLPKEMSELTNLRKLTLHVQNMLHLPEAIFHIPHLTELILACPTLEELSDSIQTLSELQLLNIFSAKLDVLPSAMLRLQELRSLSLHCPELKELPEDLGSLIDLRELTINAAALERLPHSIGRLEKLKRFNLIAANLRELPAQIGTMSNLCLLYVSSAQLHTLPEELGELGQLNELVLKPCALGELPSSLRNLQRLSVLEISSDELRITSDVIRELGQLRQLRLHSNLVDVIPDWIADLTNIQVLDFSGCGVSALPSCLAGLRGLQQIDLSHTELTELPHWVGMLSELRRLSIDSTQVRELPASLGLLRKMEQMQLSGLKLQRLPEELLSYQLPFFLRKPKIPQELGFLKILQERGIFLGSTTLATQPISLFEQPRALIEEYYNAIQIPVNEAKVIFLGDGSVGKTYTIKRMLNDCAPETGKNHYPTTETHGILIKPYHVEQNGQSFDIHFWDFGGQDIMHSMHRCFLTERTCYVVMVSTRTPDLTTGRARYWLRNIESFAHNAPVILAVNRWGVDSPHTGLDISRLKKDFPNLVQCVYFSAKSSTVEEFRQLEQTIVEQARQLDSCNMSFPEQWDGIRQELLRQAVNATYYIGRDQYHEICDKYGLSKHEGIRAWLLEWFNDLGVCFSYHQDDEQKELDDYKILDPEWLTSAVYRIIFGQGEVSNGTITIKEIQRILREKGSPDLEKKGIPCLDGVSYTDEECNYVLEIMRKFKVSYKVSDDEEFIPALCSENTPVGLAPKDQARWGSVKLNYHYLPDSVVHQMMISCHDVLQQDKCWRKGLFLDMGSSINSSLRSYGSAAVYMTGRHSEDTELQIDLYHEKGALAKGPKMILQSLLTLIQRINQTMNLQAELVVLAEKNGASEWFPFRKILKCMDRGSYEMQGEDENYEIADLLEKFGDGTGTSQEPSQYIKNLHLNIPYLSNLHVTTQTSSPPLISRYRYSLYPDCTYIAQPYFTGSTAGNMRNVYQNLFKNHIEQELHFPVWTKEHMKHVLEKPEKLRTNVHLSEPIRLERTIKSKPIPNEREETTWKKTKKKF